MPGHDLDHRLHVQRQRIGEHHLVQVPVMVRELAQSGILRLGKELRGSDVREHDARNQSTNLLHSCCSQRCFDRNGVDDLRSPVRQVENDSSVGTHTALPRNPHELANVCTECLARARRPTQLRSPRAARSPMACAVRAEIVRSERSRVPSRSVANIRIRVTRP